MNPEHAHLLLNHLPIVGSIIGFLILAYGFLSQKDAVAKVGLVVLFLVPVVAFPTQITGEKSEHSIERLEETTREDHHRIHEHSKWAHYAFFCSIAMGLLALVTFLGGTFAATVPRTLTIVTLLLAAATLGLMAQAGNTGGQIMHKEIRE